MMDTFRNEIREDDADKSSSPTPADHFCKKERYSKTWSRLGDSSHVAFRPPRLERCTEMRKTDCTWSGDVCSCCCLPLLTQLACNILPTTYKEILSVLYRKSKKERNPVSLSLSCGKEAFHSICSDGDDRPLFVCGKKWLWGKK